MGPHVVSEICVHIGCQILCCNKVTNIMIFEWGGGGGVIGETGDNMRKYTKTLKI